MTYSASSPLLGLGGAGSSTIQAWFDQHTPNCPANLGVAILAETSKAGLNADLVASQIAKETAFWSSSWAKANNPSGLGVTGQPGAGLTFPTPQAGIHAMCAHLLTYIDGTANPWKADDPRYQDVLDDGTAGSVTVLSDLDGKWAVPGVGYGASIAQIANELLATIGGGTVTSGRDPVASWMPSSNFDQGRKGLNVSHITDHMTAGTDSLNWLRGAAGGSSNTNSSATYLISRAGQVYQLVDEGNTPWTDGNYGYNQTGITIEHEHEAGQDWPEAQINASIALHARIAKRQGWTRLVRPIVAVEPEDGPTGNVIGHSQVPDPNNPNLGGGVDHHTGCPGADFPWDTLLAAANGQLAGNTPAPAPPTSWTDPQTNVPLIGGMLARWNQVKALLGDEIYLIVGHAVHAEEPQPDGSTIQRFEHETWRWRKGQSPERFDILVDIINPFVAVKP